MADPALDRLAEVRCLTSALIDQVLDAQAAGRPVPDQQAHALTQAADLLRERGVEWPPRLAQAMHGLADRPGSEGTQMEMQQPANGDLGIFEEIARALAGMRKG